MGLIVNETRQCHKILSKPQLDQLLQKLTWVLQILITQKQLFVHIYICMYKIQSKHKEITNNKANRGRPRNGKLNSKVEKQADQRISETERARYVIWLISKKWGCGSDCEEEEEEPDRCCRICHTWSGWWCWSCQLTGPLRTPACTSPGLTPVPLERRKVE